MLIALRLVAHIKRFSSKMQERLLDEAGDLHSSRKKIAIALGAAMVTTIGVILIVVFAGSVEIDSDPPGTPLPRKCGQRTAESNWPWTVEIYARDGPNSWKHTNVLGTLVNDHYVLSSAYGLEKHQYSTLRVLLGDTTFVHMVDDSYFEYRVCRDIVREEFIEPDFFSFDDGNNMLLLRMDKAIKFSGRIQPICLPWVHPEIPQQLTILPDHEHKLFNSSAYLVDYQECYKIWFFHGFDGDLKSQRTHLCAKLSDSGELKHCNALKGSPLLGVFHDNGKDRFVQYGIKHYGDCTGRLQIYTNLTHQMEWMREVVNRKEEEN